MPEHPGRGIIINLRRKMRAYRMVRPYFETNVAERQAQPQAPGLGIRFLERPMVKEASCPIPSRQQAQGLLFAWRKDLPCHQYQILAVLYFFNVDRGVSRQSYQTGDQAPGM